MLRTMASNIRLVRSRKGAGLSLIGSWHFASKMWMSSSPSVQPDTSDDIASAKPFSQIPGPKGLPLIGSLLDVPKLLKEKNGNDLIVEKFAQYGPIFKEKFGTFACVYLGDVKAIEKFHRHEGKYPRRIIINPWRHWRDENGLSRGILTEDGVDWKRMRTMLDKQMLRPKHVATYADNFNEVVTDFIQRINKIKKENDLKVPNMNQELFHWSLETIGMVLYETRLGGFSDDRQADMTKFIQAVEDLFVSTNRVIYLPVKINRIFLRKWQKLHEDSWDVIFRTTQKLIDSKFCKIQEKLSKGEDVSGFLSFLCASEMSKEEVYSNVSELMLGAVDTTSNTMQWVIYELSRNADLQKKLHAEVTAAVPAGQLPNYDSFQQMPLLKAVVKEVLRLYPVANVTTRILDEDIVLSGYHIPANTTLIGNTYALGRNSDIFPDPLAFKPERWLRSEHIEAVHNFGWLPFGFGPRSCIGRRVAELEMHLLLARISQLYVLRPVEDKPLLPALRGLLVPDRPVNVQFVDRTVNSA